LYLAVLETFYEEADEDVFHPVSDKINNRMKLSSGNAILIPKYLALLLIRVSVE